jgi:hypothetical protein
MGFVALREQIDVLKLTPGGRVAARPLEFLYYTKTALIVAPLPLGVLALGLASTPLGRRRPWLIRDERGHCLHRRPFPALYGCRSAPASVVGAPPLLAWLPTSCIVLLAATAARFLGNGRSGCGGLAHPDRDPAEALGSHGRRRDPGRRLTPRVLLPPRHTTAASFPRRLSIVSDQPAERLRGDGIGQGETAQLVEILLRDVPGASQPCPPAWPTSVSASDGAPGAAQRRLEGFDFRQIRHGGHFIAVTCWDSSPQNCDPDAPTTGPSGRKRPDWRV